MSRGAARVFVGGRRPLSSKSRQTLKRLLTSVLEDHENPGAVSIIFVTDDEMRSMHREFLGIDQVTDVISFPLKESNDPLDGLVGEVAVSVDTARRVAKRRELRLEQELALYALHGVLHLLGYDDQEPAARRKMRRAERKYLKAFGYR